MQFRWVALIALWTVLSGPVFSGLWSPSAKSEVRNPKHEIRSVKTELQPGVR